MRPFIQRALVVAVALLIASTSFFVSWRMGRRPPPTRMAGPANVVLIVGCTVRRDELTPYGGHPEATPFLDAYAKEGTLFEGGIAAAPWTKASVSALVSGQHAAEIGMVEPGDGVSRRRLPDEVLTLAERFKRAGYQTFGMTANPNLNAVFGFDQGFDTYVEGSTLWRQGGGGNLRGARLIQLAQPRMREIHDWTRPLFLQAVFTDAHQPPPKDLMDEPSPFEAPDVPESLSTYRRMLQRFDRSVKGLEMWLRRGGIHTANTIFVLVNDHGEGLGLPESHGIGHGNFTYGSAARMPWIVWGRDIPKGHRIAGMASGVDVGPTALGLARLPWKGEGGEDWSDAIFSRSPHTTRERAVIDTWFQASRRTGIYSADLNCHEDYAEIPPVHPVTGARRVPRGCWADDALTRPVEGPDADALLTELDARHAELSAAFAAYPHTRDATPPDDVRDQLEALGYAD